VEWLVSSFVLIYRYLNISNFAAELQPKFFQPTLKHNAVLPTTELESWEDATLSAPSFSSEKMLAKANYMTYY
jgi:hypothetical protein